MPARAMTYWWWADNFGFTEDDVNERMSESSYEWIPKIHAAKHRAIEIKQKQAAREARHQQRRGF
jgi:hypothetical protein